ncbi:hypothetical protein HK405_000957, partial [Cladochytrium tenue]
MAYLMGLAKDYQKQSEDELNVAIQTYDTVRAALLTDRHIRRLDDDLAKYEEEQMTGPRVAQAAGASASGASAVATAQDKEPSGASAAVSALAALDKRGSL